MLNGLLLSMFNHAMKSDIQATEVDALTARGKYHAEKLGMNLDDPSSNRHWKRAIKDVVKARAVSDQANEVFESTDFGDTTSAGKGMIGLSARLGRKSMLPKEVAEDSVVLGDDERL